MKLDSIEFQNEFASIGIGLDSRIPDDVPEFSFAIQTFESSELLDSDRQPTSPQLQFSCRVRVDNWEKLHGFEFSHDQSDLEEPSILGWVSNPQMADEKDFSIRLKKRKGNIFSIDLSAYFEIHDLGDKSRLVLL